MSDDFGTLDCPALERQVLDLWQKERPFETLRRRNRGGPRFAFLDGPVTANNPRGLGVHHAWGRTYKDVFQRYWAMRGYDQRYQNGYDCQGLWVEVEVEKELGLGTKADIDAYGLERFAQACRRRVAGSAAAIERSSRRLGQWMDWQGSYYTHSDANIEHVWHFLRHCHERGWLYKGSRVVPWCVRCGTSLSQHELADSHRPTTHRSVYCRLPLNGEPDAYFLVWTTTPWTLPANVALAVHPGLEYVGVRHEGRLLYLSAAAAEQLLPAAPVQERLPGARLVGRGYRGPFDALPAQAGVEHRVVAWEEVAADEGTGVVHVAPGCGVEDFALGRQQGLPLLAPLDEGGRYCEGYGALEGTAAATAVDTVFGALQAQGMLHGVEAVEHRYPHCWRCRTELVFRPSEEWFLACDELRPRLLEEAAKVEWRPAHAGLRLRDWLCNMDDWCISRQRYWGLPLPFFEAADGRLLVVGSRAELRALAADPAQVDALPELHRPWLDSVALRLPDGTPLKRVAAVGDCWLDAGIAPFSTLGYLQDRAHWQRWFPADFATEMSEQLRLWFYAALFTSVALTGQAPYRRVLTYGKMRDTEGRPMHKSAGNALWFDEAVETLGAEPMRWLFAGHNPAADLRFGEPAVDLARRQLSTWWNSCRFFAQYARVDGWAAGNARPACPTLLDRWLLSRLQGTVAAVGRGLEGCDLPGAVGAVAAFWEDLSNWYVRLSRRRFWKSADDADKEAAYRTLYTALETLCRLTAPVLPFLSEALYQRLAFCAAPQMPSSVHLGAFPQADTAQVDTLLEKKMASLRRTVALGRAARAQSGLKLRQPLAALYVWSASGDAVSAELEELLRAELNVRRVERLSDKEGLYQYCLELDFRRAGRRLGAQGAAVAAALARLEPAALRRALAALRTGDGDLPLEVEGKGVVLRRQEVRLVEAPRPNRAVAAEGDRAVGLDTCLDDGLRDEGRARELVHRIQRLRQTAGLDVTDRILLYYRGGPLLRHTMAQYGPAVRRETLCLRLAEGPADGAVAAAETLQLDGESVQLQLVKAGC